MPLVYPRPSQTTPTTHINTDASVNPNSRAVFAPDANDDSLRIALATTMMMMCQMKADMSMKAAEDDTTIAEMMNGEPTTAWPEGACLLTRYRSTLTLSLLAIQTRYDRQWR